MCTRSAPEPWMVETLENARQTRSHGAPLAAFWRACGGLDFACNQTGNGRSAKCTNGTDLATTDSLTNLAVRKVIGFSAILRLFASPLLVLVLLTSGGFADQLPQKGYSLPRREQVIGFLTESVEWYRGSSVTREMPIQPADVPFRESSQSLRIQSLRLSFDYAKAVATAEAHGSISPDQPTDPAVPNSSGTELQRLTNLETQCEADAQSARNDLASIRTGIETRRERDKARLKIALAESESRLDLDQAGCQTYKNLMIFVRTMNASESQNPSLDAVIDDLSRTVPELTNAGEGAQQSQSAISSGIPPATGLSIPFLISDVLSYRKKLHALDAESRETGKLARTAQDLRTPLAQYLNSAFQSVNFSSKDPQSSDLYALRQQQERVDNLSAQITALAPAIIALDKQKTLFSFYKSDLARWRTLAVSEYASAWKLLSIYLLAVGIVIVVLFGVARALRRFTFRYVHDPTRRRTILLGERILLWTGTFLLVLLTFVPDLRSLATFLGILTAGLAVALQNVILAVLGYSVLVGKLGLRLGDQIQISGVTGEVVELGFLQFQVKEFDAQGYPTGRLGSFSNSFVFVSPAIGIFKVGVMGRDTNVQEGPLVDDAHLIGPRWFSP